MKSEQVIDHIVGWLKSYCTQARLHGFVIGVSGGIDSALTSTLCAKTGLPLLCIEMPIHQSEKQVKRAMNHIDWMQSKFDNVKKTTINLTAVFDSLVHSFPPVDDEEDRMMALANTRARLRMTSLYYFAALNGYLVAGTGNKVEDFGIGFFTKYGDGGVDISPIADLLKSEVYELAIHLGINQEIIDAPPTDGLWGDNRTDEDQIGASYPELEWAMDFVERNGQIDQLTERQKKVLDIYMRFNTMNKHKMAPIPICNIPEELK